MTVETCQFKKQQQAQWHLSECSFEFSSSIKRYFLSAVALIKSFTIVHHLLEA
jgi:hypothetical protein